MAGLIGSHATVVSSGAERKKHYNITTTTTSLTGLQYTPTKVHVYHNGIRLVDGTDYTATNGTSITLTNAAENGDDVVVISYATFQVSDTVSKTTGGTFEDAITIDADGATVLTVDRATSDGTIIDVQRGGTSTAVIGVSASDDVYFAGATGSSKGIYFNANGLLPATTGGSASDGTVDIGESITRWKDLYLSGGLYVGGTGSANQLDDYEEGTWTPTFVKDGGATITYGGQTGVYTKVGRMVNVTGRIQTNTFSGGSGQIRIGSLPFTSGSYGSDMFAATISVAFGGWGSTDAPSAGFVAPSATEIKLYAFDYADARNQRDTATSSSGDGSVGLIFSCTYYV